MKRFSIVILFLLVRCISFGQNDKDTTALKTLKKYQGKTVRLLEHYDKNGNRYFVKNNGLNGNIIMIWGDDFDSQNRISRSLWVHTNIGFSVNEYVYEPSSIKTYSYILDTTYKRSTNHSTYNLYRIAAKINSKKELEQRIEIINLLKGKKYLLNIAYVDSNNRIIKEISFNENGDTSSIRVSRYNKWNKVEYFHNEWKGEIVALWDIYGEFDSKGNKVKWVRIEENSGKRDTGEIYHYAYSPTNKLKEYSQYDRTKKFVFRTVYEFNNNDKMIKETYYEDHPQHIAARYYYTYNKKGNLIREVLFDLKKNRHKPDYIYKTKYQYWH